MKPFACLPLFALVSSAFAAPSVADQWESFRELHGKKVAPHEEAIRKAAFIQKSAQIAAHNARYEAGLESFSLKLNQYSDLNGKEFGRVGLGFTPLNDSLPVAHSLEAMPSIPTSLDYRQLGLMTPMRDQGGCGSCYAFAAAGVLESYLVRTKRQAYDLSEQEVVDCSYRKYMGGNANGGCAGGHPSAVFDHFNNKDVFGETQYRYESGYTGRHGACRYPNIATSLVRGTLRPRHVMVQREADLRQYLVQFGPVVIGMAADNEHKDLFRNLGDGIFDDISTASLQPNHVVVLCGYGTQNGKDFWIIKNSWGTSWGNGGYGRLAANKNMANIMTSGIWYLE
jgi:cathepsin L